MTTTNNTTPLALQLRAVVIQTLGAPLPGQASSELNAAVAKLVGKTAEIYSYREFVKAEEAEWRAIKAGTP